MPAANSHAWDNETNVDVLKVMNNYYHPNAEDCRKMIGALREKGYEFSDNALLYGFFRFPLHYIPPSSPSTPSSLLPSLKFPPSVSLVAATADRPTPSLPQKKQSTHCQKYFIMGRILQKWDAECHDDILMAMLKHFAPKTEDWRAIIATLRDQGYTFTESALPYVGFPKKTTSLRRSASISQYKNSS